MKRYKFTVSWYDRKDIILTRYSPVTTLMLNNFFSLSIAVIRCRDLCRQNGGAINAYVKVRDNDKIDGLKFDFVRKSEQNGGCNLQSAKNDNIGGSDVKALVLYN